VTFYDFTASVTTPDAECLSGFGEVHARAAVNGARHGTPVLVGPGGWPDPRVNLFFRTGPMAGGPGCRPAPPPELIGGCVPNTDGLPERPGARSLSVTRAGLPLVAAATKPARRCLRLSRSQFRPPPTMTRVARPGPPADRPGVAALGWGEACGAASVVPACTSRSSPDNLELTAAMVTVAHPPEGSSHQFVLTYVQIW
jgi:hypothetical protein